MEESGEILESSNHEADATGGTRNEENERYFEILQNYELERLQKEAKDKEVEEQLLKDIDLAKALSLEQDELEEAMSNGSDETRVMQLVESRYTNGRPDKGRLGRRTTDRQRRRSDNGDDSDQHEDIPVSTPQQSDDQDEVEYSHELRYLKEHGLVPSDHGIKRDDVDAEHEIIQTVEVAVVHTVNGQHSPQHRDNTNEAHQFDEVPRNEAVEFEYNEIFPNGMVMDFLNPYPFDSDGIPQNWNKSNIPPRDSSELYRLTELFAGQDEYETIATDFCMADLEVVKIERLQSPTLLGRFRGEQDHLKTIRPAGFNLNLRYLYHGTTCDKLRICEEGLDARLGMTGCFGRGIYFSDNPKKCIQYAGNDSRDNGHLPFILMCRVILGDAKIYPKGRMDRDLKREPEKEAPAGGWRFYDSVKGCPIDFNEFVVYENRRAMIEYIITFKNAPEPFEKQDSASSSVATVPSAISEVNYNNGGASASGRTLINDDSDEDDEFTRFFMSQEMWEHMKRIEAVRESVRQKRAIEKGEVYVGPTREQKRKDRIMWRKVLKINHPPGYGQIEPEPPTSSEQTPNINNNEADKESEPGNEEASSQEENPTIPTDADRASIREVEIMLLSDFMVITQNNDDRIARLYLERCAMILDHAIALYFEEKT